MGMRKYRGINEAKLEEIADDARYERRPHYVEPAYRRPLRLCGNCKVDVHMAGKSGCVDEWCECQACLMRAMEANSDGSSQEGR